MDSNFRDDAPPEIHAKRFLPASINTPTSISSAPQPGQTCINNPPKVVAALLKTMAGLYGAKFADAWRGVAMADIQRTWEMALATYTMAEVHRGVLACHREKWPPMLPEFLMLCRPPIVPEVAFYEAVEQMVMRDRGEDQWSHPVIYWAATRMGTELRTAPYVALKYRWQRAVEGAQADFDAGLVGVVPERALALENRYTPTPMPDHVRAALATFSATVAARMKMMKAGDEN